MDEFQGLDDELLQIAGGAEEDPAPIEKVRDYYVTTVGGLEEVVLRDLKSKLKGMQAVRVEPGHRHGRIFFRYERSPRNLLDLDSVQNVYALLGTIHGVTVGRPGLLKLARGAAAADIVPGVALHDLLHGPRDSPWMSLTCTVGRGHRFSPSELHQVIRTVVTTKYGIPDQGEGPAYRLHLQVAGRRGLLGLQLTARQPGRRAHGSSGPGGDLDSTVAYCMGLLAGVEKRDLCVDPMCGGTATLIESTLGFQPAGIIAGDIDRGALAEVRQRVGAAQEAPRLCLWDAGRLPLGDNSADKVLCKLPFNKRVPVARDGHPLAEFVRVLKPKRTAVLLAADKDAMADSLDSLAGVLDLVRRVPVHIRGTRAWIYVLKRAR